MDTINKRLGLNVRRYRKRLGITQEQLAEKCEKSLGTIQLLESGKVWPELATIVRLAETFDVPDRALFEAENGSESVRGADTNLLRELLLTLATLDDDEIRSILADARAAITARRGPPELVTAPAKRSPKG